MATALNPELESFRDIYKYRAAVEMNLLLNAMETVSDPSFVSSPGSPHHLRRL
jgi:hypothetical protein